MQIVIDIPEEIYKKAKETHDVMCDHVWLGIKNGTPLPKGHGRLIDADRLLKEHSDDITDWKEPFGVQNDNISNAPTIIEADKESEE